MSTSTRKEDHVPKNPAVDQDIAVEVISTVVRNRRRQQLGLPAENDPGATGIGWLPNLPPTPAPEAWVAHMVRPQARPAPDTTESDLERAVRARGELDRQRTEADQIARGFAYEIATGAAAFADAPGGSITPEDAEKLVELATRLLRHTEHAASLDHTLRSVYGPRAARSRT